MYSATQYKVAVEATVQILARAGVEVKTSEFGSTIVNAYRKVGPATQASIQHVVRGLTGGTVEDLYATRTSRRPDTAFVRVEMSALVAKLRERAMIVIGHRPALASDSAAVKAFVESINETLISRESGGILNISWRNRDGGATDGRGVLMTASGPFQYIMSTWNDIAKRYRLDVKQYTSGLEYRSDTYKMVPGSPGDLEAACTVHAIGLVEAASALRVARLPINDQTMYLCHFAGISGAVRTLKTRSIDPAILRLDVNPSAARFAQSAIKTLAA